MSKMQVVKTLKEAKYSFDSVNSVWYCGKKPINEEDVLIRLIQYAKSQNIRNAGEFAESELKSAKSSPEITSREFIQAHIRRNRNRRTAGKYLFREWCISVGIEIIGSLEDFTRANSLLVSRFYNEISEAGYHIRKQARVIGRVLRSVFLGVEIIDESQEADPHQSITAGTKKQVPSQSRLTAIKAYNDFMTRLFDSGSKPLPDT